MKSEARLRLAAVRTSWRPWQSPLPQYIAQGPIASGFCWPSSLVDEKWWHASMFVGIFGVSQLNQYLRDWAWRRLVEIEAPELYGKISRINA